MVVTASLILCSTARTSGVPGLTSTEEKEVIEIGLKLSRRYDHIYLMFFNDAYFDFVKSWICNIRLVEAGILEQTLFVAADAGAEQKLREFEPAASMYCQHGDRHQDVVYGTHSYFRITLDRLYIQNALLQHGINVFVVEADAAWFSPVSEYVANLQMDGSTIVSADDRGGGRPLISAGFLYFPWKLRRFFMKYVAKYEKNLQKYERFIGSFADKDPGEQHLMTKLLKKNRMSVHWLDDCHFARGEWYSQKAYRYRCPHPEVIQNNYIEGNSQKRHRAEAWGHWFLKQDGTCLSQMPQINPLVEFRDCPGAIHELSAFHVKPLKISKAVVQILDAVDHTYLLTTDANGCKSRAPSDLRGKISCVLGKTLDACLFSESSRRVMDYSELSSSHHAFVHLHARAAGHSNIAVLEADLITAEMALESGEIENLKSLLLSDAWTIIRVGRMPYFLEALSQPDSCPEACLCRLDQNYGSHLCKIRSPGCDMRSSEFYISSDRVFSAVAEKVNDDTLHEWQRVDHRKQQARAIRRPAIDQHVLPSFSNQWHVLPQLSFQGKLRDLDRDVVEDTTVLHQKRVAELFQKLCVIPRV